MQTLRAIGLIAGEYEYIDRFDDVNGWDLPHARRVRWFRLPDEYDFGRPVFAGRHRFARVQVPDVVDYARRFIDSPPTAWQTAALPELPDEEAALSEMPDAIAKLVGLAQDLHSLYWSTEYFGDRPCEDELVAHFRRPLLRALGWPPERIAVKWRHVDVAAFTRCRVIPSTVRSSSKPSAGGWRRMRSPSARLISTTWRGLQHRADGRNPSPRLRRGPRLREDRVRQPGAAATVCDEGFELLMRT